MLCVVCAQMISRCDHPTFQCTQCIPCVQRIQCIRCIRRKRQQVSHRPIQKSCRMLACISYQSQSCIPIIPPAHSQTPAKPTPPTQPTTLSQPQTSQQCSQPSTSHRPASPHPHQSDSPRLPRDPRADHEVRIGQACRDKTVGLRLRMVVVRRLGRKYR